jgi:hypothetical protein
MEALFSDIKYSSEAVLSTLKPHRQIAKCQTDERNLSFEQTNIGFVELSMDSH